MLQLPYGNGSSRFGSLFYSCAIKRLFFICDALAELQTNRFKRLF
jgi:hypothetical protein